MPSTVFEPQSQQASGWQHHTLHYAATGVGLWRYTGGVNLQLKSFFNYIKISVNLLKPTGHVMHRQFNIQQLYVLPTLYLCVLYLSENKQRIVPLTA